MNISKRLALFYKSGGMPALAESFFFNVSSAVISRLVILGAGVLISRQIGVKDFSSFSQFLFAVSMIASASISGTSTAAIKFVAARATDTGANAKVIATFQINIFLWTIVSVAALFIGDIVSEEIPVPVLIIGALIFALNAISSSIVTGLKDQRRFFEGTLIFSAAFGVGVMVALYAGNYVYACIAYAVALGLQAAYQLWYGFKALNLAFLKLFHISSSAWRSCASQIGFLSLASVIMAAVPWWLSSHLEKLDDGGVSMAIFAISLNLFGLVLLLPIRLAHVLFADQVEAHNAKTDISVARQSNQRMQWAAAGIACVGSIGVILMLDPILGLYAEAVRDQRWAVALFVAAAPIAAAYSISGNNIVAQDGERDWAAISFLWSIIIVGIVYFGSVSGGFVPAVAYLSAYAIGLLATWIVNHYRLTARH